MSRRTLILFTTFLLLTLLVIAETVARADGISRVGSKKTGGPSRVLVLGGAHVHNVNELHIHVSDWGMFGSWPGTGRSFSEAPSARVPGG
jgi:hypothetical protein